jgi:metal-responsive CopG/Arc/MetJ family transcriptional regulator
MPTKKEVLCFPSDPDLLKRIDDYRYDNRIPSRSEAIRQLIEEGLKAKASPKGKAKTKGE